VARRKAAGLLARATNASQRCRSHPVLFSGLGTTSTPVARKSELDQLKEAVRKAAAELDAATKLSEVKAAAKRLQRAKAHMKAAEDAKAGGGS
jgi:hypothetical protein